MRLLTGHSWRFQTSDATGGQILFHDIVLHDTAATVEEGVARVQAANEFVLSRGAETNSTTLGLYATTRFLLDPTGIGWVVAESDDSGTPRAHYLYGLRSAARVEADGTIHYYGFDRSGHTRLMTDSRGAVVRSESTK